MGQPKLLELRPVPRKVRLLRFFLSPPRSGGSSLTFDGLVSLSIPLLWTQTPGGSQFRPPIESECLAPRHS